MPVVTTCEVSGLFRSCGQPGVAVCQYCGRSFCEEHGSREADGQEICSRKPCQRKRADLARHVAYMAQVRERNERKRCGEVDCDAAPAGQCSKCQGYYCAGHLAERRIETRRGSDVARAWASVCRHCHGRRRIWDRV